MSVIKVRFDREKHGPVNNREYVYFCDYAVEVGDRVVVDSPYNGYVVVTVTDTSAGLESINATKEVVCLIDDSRYNARKVAKARLVEIGAEIERRQNEVVRTKKFRKFFKKDKEALGLLDEADNLTNVLKGDPAAFLVEAFKAEGVEILVADSPADMVAVLEGIHKGSMD